MKPGYKTTEFWLALLTAVGAVLVALGVIDKADVDNIAQAISALATAAVALYVALQPVREYIKSRTLLKSQ